MRRLFDEAVEITPEVREALEGGALDHDMEIAALRLQSILVADGYRVLEYVAAARELRNNRMMRPQQVYTPLVRRSQPGAIT
jgi:hypothetical protein